MGRFNFRIFLLLIAISSSGCSSLLYAPLKRVKVYEPSKIGLHEEEIWIDSLDQNRLHGWYFKNKENKPAKAILLFFHGNGENLSTHFASLAWILDYGYDYIIFDYRGYGFSDDMPLYPEATVRDGISALRYTKNRFKDTPLVVFGQSLGGAVALRALYEVRNEIGVHLLVIDSSFLSYQKVSRRVLSHHALTWLFQPLAWLVIRDGWSPLNKTKDLPPWPKLVLHGDKDQIVDFDLGKELFDELSDPKEFWQIKDGLHTDAFWRHRGEYREKFLIKLESLFAKKNS